MARRSSVRKRGQIKRRRVGDQMVEKGAKEKDEENDEMEEKEIANCVHMQAAAKSQTCL